MKNVNHVTLNVKRAQIKILVLFVKMGYKEIKILIIVNVKLDFISLTKNLTVNNVIIIVKIVYHNQNA